MLRKGFGVLVPVHEVTGGKWPEPETKSRSRTEMSRMETRVGRNPKPEDRRPKSRKAGRSPHKDQGRWKSSDFDLRVSRFGLRQLWHPVCLTTQHEPRR